MAEFKTISVRVHTDAHAKYRDVAKYYESQGMKVWAWVEQMVEREYQHVNRLQKKDAR